MPLVSSDVNGLEEGLVVDLEGAGRCMGGGKQIEVECGENTVVAFE